MNLMSSFRNEFDSGLLIKTHTNMMVQFAYPWVLIVGLLGGLGAWIVWRMFGSPVVYRHAFATRFAAVSSPESYVPLFLRFMIAGCLLLATARPRTPDERTEISVDGIGIMLALDVSRSMTCFDDIKNQKPRFTIAQEEAVRFVARRSRDICGLILFGAIAATRCPLTYDRRMLTTILQAAQVGMIPDEGTALSQAIMMGVRRLQASAAHSNILVLLTDGEPSPDDIPYLDEAVKLAQTAGVRVYTIGIGSAQGGYIRHPIAGIVQVESRCRPELLREIAQKTGGASFEARNQRELAAIYDAIDQLERTRQQEPVYAQWHEWYVPLVLGAFLLLLCDIGMMAWQLRL